MNWLIGLVFRFLDSTIQRTIAPGNRLQTVGGIAGGAGILVAMDYMETQLGCNLSEFKLAALVPLLQGAFATGNGQSVPKVIERSKGDEAHDKDGGGAA